MGRRSCGDIFVLPGMVVLNFPPKNNQQRKNVPTSPIGVLHPRCLRLFFLHPLPCLQLRNSKNIFPVGAFKVKLSLASAKAKTTILKAQSPCFSCTSSHVSLAWFTPPPLRATLSLGLEKRFLSLIMVVRFGADGQDGVTFLVLYLCVSFDA